MPDSNSLLALTPAVTQTPPGTSSLLARAPGLEAGASPGKIRRSAQEFESILLSQWLEQAREAFAGVPGGDEDNDDPGQGQMMALGMQALASAVVKSGGVGIARMLEHFLTKQADGTAAKIGEK